MRVVLAHSFDIVVQGLRKEMAAFPGLDLRAVVHSGAELEKALRDGCDLLVTGLFMPGFEGLDAVAELATGNPRVKIIVLTAYPQYSRAARKLGIPGYVLKSESASRIAHAIHVVAKGGTYYSEEPPTVRAPTPKPDVLSPRELEVLLAVARGCRNAEIARGLGITTRTVEFHKQNIKERLDLETSADLIRYVYEHALASR